VSDITVRSEIAGKVFDIVAQIGQRLEVDDPIIVLESMKMEIPVAAPKAGVLREIRVAREETIEEDQVVAILSAV
jgi:acetyl-CoA carboxylase biotin carboxyl carrier protein